MDPDPYWIRIGIQPKMLDPDPAGNKCGSKTLPEARDEVVGEEPRPHRQPRRQLQEQIHSIFLSETQRQNRKKRI